MKKKPYMLSVREKEGTQTYNEVSKAPGPQLITWRLIGHAQTGRFLDNAADSFEWKETTPDGVFGEASVSSDGKELTLGVMHPDAASNGHWSYQLRAVIDGTLYETPYSLAKRRKSKTKKKKRSKSGSVVTNTNPTIVNK